MELSNIKKNCKQNLHVILKSTLALKKSIKLKLNKLNCL